MRDALKALSEKDYWVYGLNESDFDFTIELVSELIENNQQKLQAKITGAKKRYPDEDIWCEIQSDYAHYAWVNEQYLWQFCLWRLQGIFEALILNDFLPEKPTKRLIGLQAKLSAAEHAGFKLEAAEKDELTLWGNLRNALSHAPPEQYRPAPLDENDIKEYIGFLKSICKKWREQQKTL